MHDVVIIGGGHNGLACAGYLAKAGKRVLVLEANPTVGGFVVTNEIPGAPGYLANRFAMEFPFQGIEPSVASELELARFGLEWATPDPHQTHMSEDGTPFSLYHSIDRTCESIARLSRRDAEYYRQWMGALRDVASAAFPYLQGHPTRVHPRTIARIVRRLARHRKSLLPGARALLSAPSEVLAGFEREEVRAFLAMNVATGSFRPIDEPANMSAMVYFAMLHLYRLHRPIGGSGAYCEALARAVRSWGGEIRTSSPVERIAIHNGKAVGVVLRSGETILASQVISATDPVSLVTKLLADADVPPITRTEVDRLQVNANNVAHFKADLAVSRRPRFVKPGIQEEHFGGGMSFAPSQAHAHRTLTEIINGGLSDEPPFFYIAVPSVLDRSLVPAGSDGDSIFVWVGAVPHEFADGRTWETEKQPFFDKVIDHLERFIPDLRSTIVGQQVTSPADMNVEWVHKGSARGVDVVPSQMGPWRPTPSLAGYRTPFGGLWHTGHGAHPMSGTSGWPGRIAARTVLKALD